MPGRTGDIVDGDVCAAFAYTTEFQRLAVAPEAALAFFRRDHGLSTTPGYVLAQGEVTFPDTPPDGYAAALHDRWRQYLGPVPEGGVVRKLGGDAYYDYRLPVTLHVRRLLYWPDAGAVGEPAAVGEPLPPPPPQQPPKHGSEPQVATRKLAKQFRRDNDHLLGFIDGGGCPVIVPFTPQADGERITVPRTDLPVGGRRAAIMGLWYNRELHGQGGLTARGWLEATPESGSLAVTSSRVFNLPGDKIGQKVIVPIALGFLYRKAVRSSMIRDGGLIRRHDESPS